MACVFAGCSRKGVERLAWSVMGTEAAVQTRRGDEAVLARVHVQSVFAALERLLNAHNPHAEISSLAALDDAGVLAQCDKSVSNCYATAFRLRDETGGAFNPRWRGTNTLDLGAIAKGFAVDEAAATSPTRGDLLIDLGGNLKAVRGDWRTGIVGGDSFLLHAGEACATSGEYYRGKHIKDGRTGRDLTNTVYAVTVIHPTSAMLADGLSTALFVLGREKGDAFLAAHYPEARAIWIAK